MFTRISKRKSFRKGLSIIEVAMASALLIIAMIPILKSLTRANMMSNDLEKKTQCLILAKGKLDEIRARSIYNFGTTGSFTANNVVINGSYLCNIQDSDITADLKQITASAGCDENGDGSLSSSEIEVTLTTCFARRW